MIFPVMTTKTIKRYQNRKLYDTDRSCYITLDDLAKMIRQGDEIVVIDNKTQKDITSNTLTQIIFESEKKSKTLIPAKLLTDIIKSGGGSISDLFQKTLKSGAREIAHVKGKIQKKIDTVTGVSHLHSEIERLEHKVQELQNKLKSYEDLEHKEP